MGFPKYSIDSPYFAIAGPVVCRVLCAAQPPYYLPGRRHRVLRTKRPLACNRAYGENPITWNGFVWLDVCHFLGERGRPPPARAEHRFRRVGKGGARKGVGIGYRHVHTFARKIASRKKKEPVMIRKKLDLG